MKPGRIESILLAVLLTVSLPAQADEAAQPNADDAVIEQRLVDLAEDLRCLVCQNESLAGSQAALAEDLRREIRAQMKAGKDDREVVAYLTERYGDFVLYRPPFKPVTWLLWLGPALFLGIGGGAWVMTLRRRRDMQAAPLDETKRAAAAQLLEEK
ncbi:cytochrome c-type biogenesis protein [Thiobacillus sp.]|uniref:cytochrome c-type biogenesis protein n=1 Tax=Thiobacillus sp. TaxID=924 RepID=UPI0025DDF5AA|nr:cytochrome c-type biogenesis protein [Thiobacillus sp.]